MVLIDKGNDRRASHHEEMSRRTQPRVRQFLDRVAEPEVSREIGLFANANGGSSLHNDRLEQGRESMKPKSEQALVGLFVIVATALLIGIVFAN